MMYLTHTTLIFLIVTITIVIAILVRKAMLYHLVKYFIVPKKKKVTFDESKNTIMYYEKYL